MLVGQFDGAETAVDSLTCRYLGDVFPPMRLLPLGALENISGHPADTDAPVQLIKTSPAVSLQTFKLTPILCHSAGKVAQRLPLSERTQASFSAL